MFQRPRFPASGFDSVQFLLNVGLLAESGRGFEHHTILHAQISEWLIGTIVQPHREFNVVFAGHVAGRMGSVS